MKEYFSFNSDIHDFWPVYNTISKYYPIGIRLDSYVYHQYQGQKDLGKILVDNIHNAENFKERFVDFSEEIQSKFGLEVQGTTYGQQPAFSLEVVLEKAIYPGLTKFKKLCLAVSLLGDFYAIFGTDETIISDDQKPYPGQYHAINAVTVSPYLEFERYYLELKAAIQAKYPNHKQVPFSILTSYIDGLVSKFDLIDQCTVYNALFDQKLTGNYLLRQRGDKYYPSEEWIREGADLSAMKSIEVIVMPPPPISPTK